MINRSNLICNTDPEAINYTLGILKGTVVAPQKGSFRRPLGGFFGKNPYGFFERGFFDITLKGSFQYTQNNPSGS